LTTLNKLSFFQYKNYEAIKWDFWGKIICICGGNGKGKTNLIDAIYYLSYTKSYLGFKDAQMQQHSTTGINIQGNFTNSKEQCRVKIISRDGAKKELWVNDAEVKQHYLHAGKLPCVFIGPDDVEIITGSSELRRKLMDATIGQVNKEYLIALSKYNKTLLQRNALLKNWQDAPAENQELITFYDETLIAQSTYIFQARKEFMHAYLQTVEAVFKILTNEEEPIFLSYTSLLNNKALSILLKETLQKDILLGRTTCGIHKDDIQIGFSSDILVKETASQGQKKTMLFALKLAQFNYLKQNLESTPILLLDDVFEKLDTDRSAQLLKFIEQANCQVFITDTQKSRLEHHFNGNVEVQYVDL
jgi:DNA replication and repair protein RecF